MAGAWASRFVALQRGRDEAVIRGAFRVTPDASPPAVTSAPPAPPAPAPVDASGELQDASEQPVSVLVRVRQLVTEGHGRPAIVKRLGISEHQARQAIAEVKAEQRAPLRAVGGGR